MTVNMRSEQARPRRRRSALVLPALTLALLWPPASARGAMDTRMPTDLRYTGPLGVEVGVPTIAQRGDIANCGPTAVAMVLGAYRGLANGTALSILRDDIGMWSWDRFPRRAWHLPGADPGMTTPSMLHASLHAFAEDLRFARVSHPFLPMEAWALPALRGAVAQGRPVIALVDSSVIWGTSRPGLHWVVVRGFDDDQVLYNDPGDAGVFTIPAHRFWLAWRLNGVFRNLPGLGPFVGFAATRAVPGWSRG